MGEGGGADRGIPGFGMKDVHLKSILCYISMYAEMFNGSWARGGELSPFPALSPVLIT